MQDTMKMLTELRDGEMLADLEEAVRQADAAVAETGKAATVTVAITIKPAAKGNTSMVSITDAIRTKLPQPDKGETILFRTKDGTYSRRDSRQPELPIKVVAANVDTETGEIREASNG